MKNKRIFKTFSALCAALVLMRYLSVMSKFHRYSVNNTMLIYKPSVD